MKRIIAVILLFVVPVAQAEPRKHWYKDPKALLIVGAALASSAIATKMAHDCRVRNGEGPCNGGYGAFGGREGVRFGFTAGLTALSLGMRHDDLKGWPAFALGVTAFNLTEGLKDNYKSCGPGRHFLEGTKSTCVPN